MGERVELKDLFMIYEAPNHNNSFLQALCIPYNTAKNQTTHCEQALVDSGKRKLDVSRKKLPAKPDYEIIIF